VSVLDRPKDAIYRLHQEVWSAWARRRYREELAAVERFLLFVGYPRSGHSIVGAMLNAHRDAVVAHELDAPPLIVAGCSRDDLFSRILARAYWFNMRGNRANYPYAVPGQWQGRFETLRVIGDKRGGSVTTTLADHPGFFGQVRSLVGIPLRFVHVVRNPFDNISAISIWHTLSLEDSIDFYFRHWATTARLDELCAPEELLLLHHEELVRDPKDVLSRLLDFLELEAYPGYLADCSRVVYDQPTRTRHRSPWTADLVRDVERRIRPYPPVAGYTFET
jgi:hypothetical protein